MRFWNIHNANGKCLDLVLSNARDSAVVVTASNDPFVDEDHYHSSLWVSIVLNSPLSRFLKGAADIKTFNLRKANFADLYHAMINAVADVTAEGPQRGGEATPTQGLDATYPNSINSKNIKNSEILV
jgi:hypothetical protein